jgi:hypothetical protein
VLSVTSTEVQGQVVNGVHHLDQTGISTAFAVQPCLNAGISPEYLQLSLARFTFAFDPDDIGLTAVTPWYSPRDNRHNASKWHPTPIATAWADTPTGATWRAAHGGSDFTGIGWYRGIITLPERLASNSSRSSLYLTVNACGRKLSSWLNGVALPSRSAVLKSPEVEISSSGLHNGSHTGSGSELISFDLGGSDIPYKSASYQDLVFRLDGGSNDQHSLLGTSTTTSTTSKPGLDSLVCILSAA